MANSPNKLNLLAQIKTVPPVQPADPNQAFTPVQTASPEQAASPVSVAAAKKQIFHFIDFHNISPILLVRQS